MFSGDLLLFLQMGGPCCGVPSYAVPFGVYIRASRSKSVIRDGFGKRRWFKR